MVTGPTARRPLPIIAPTVTIAGRDLDPCQILVPLEITIGRSGIDSQPEAPTATIDIIGLPTGVSIGDDVSIAIRPDRADLWSDIWSDIWSEDATPPDDAWSDTWSDMWSTDPSTQPRMSGRVSDISVERQGQDVRTRITVSGRMAALGGRIGDQPWAAQSEESRVAAVAAAAAIPVSCRPAESRGVRRLDVDSRSALDVLQTMASGCGALLTEDPDGTIWYQPLGWRQRDEHPMLLLDGCSIVDDVGWEQAGPTTAVVISYGYPPVPPEGEQASTTRPSLTVRDAAAEVALGEHLVRIESEYIGEASAREVATHIVRSRAWGTWEAPLIMLPLHLRRTMAEYREAVAQLRPGARIETIGVPASPSGDVSGRLRWVVEGWRETWGRSGDQVEHWMQIAVSPAGPWLPPRAVSITLHAEYVPTHPEGPQLHVVAAASGLGSQQPRPRLEVAAGGVWLAGGPADQALDVWVPVRDGWRSRRLPVVAWTAAQPGWRPSSAEADVFIPGA